jgi:hypothetical protein
MRWLFLLCALAGCGSLSSLVPSDWRDTGPPDDVEEPEGPFLRLGQGRRESDARLISQQGERRIWRTRGGVVVATDGIRIVATAGLPVMVAATRFDGPDPVADPQSIAGRSADARRVVDVMTASREPSQMRFGITLNCRLSSAPSEEAETVIITETCRGEGLGAIRNRFWMDRESRSIHTSEQWVGPRSAPMRVAHHQEAARGEPATPAATRANEEPAE